MTEPSPHHVLQLHGGGTLVLCEIMKCAVLEKTTGRRINELFQTTICDSGGAIARLCLEQTDAEKLLETFIAIIGDTFPGKRFYYTQPLSRGSRRFDSSLLQKQLRGILQDQTLQDFQGNLFVGAHEHGEGAIKFEKFTDAQGVTQYKNASPTTPLSSIATMTSTIPGIFNETLYSDAEHADGTYLDSIVNQNPTAILAQMTQTTHKDDLFFVQMGNIEEKNIVHSLLKRSVMTSRMLNLHWKYIVHQLHSSHLADAARVIGDENVETLITYGEGRFTPSDASIDQMTRVTVATLSDIEKRDVDYTKLALRLNHHEPLVMSVAQAVQELKIVLDPIMKKRTVMISQNEMPPAEFPSPYIIRAEDTPFYQHAYALGSLTKAFAPRLSEYLVESDFKLGDAFRLAYKSGLRKLAPSAQNRIEP